MMVVDGQNSRRLSHRGWTLTRYVVTAGGEKRINVSGHATGGRAKYLITVQRKDTRAETITQ